jgi:hypothetical protein
MEHLVVQVVEVLVTDQAPEALAVPLHLQDKEMLVEMVPLPLFGTPLVVVVVPELWVELQLVQQTLLLAGLEALEVMVVLDFLTQ